MRILKLLVAAGVTASLVMVLQAEQGAAPAPAGAAGQGGARGAGQGGGRTGGAAAPSGPIGGTLTPATPDARGWG